MQEIQQNGLCTICGYQGNFPLGNERSLRESYACPNCRFTLRWRDQASVIIDEFGRGQALSIDDLVSKKLLQDVAIYEPALRGPFVQRLRGLKNYTRSYFRPDEPLGTESSDGVRNEDLTQLTFDEDSFDLIISSDVMEHLPNIELAFAETLRVLRPGGVHVFTIPNDFPFPDRTEPRVKIVNGQEIFTKPARYHNSGDGTKCLVYTDYGADISDMLRSLGGRLAVVRRSIAHNPSYSNATFVLRKIVSAGARRPVSHLGQSPELGQPPQNPAPALAKSGGGAVAAQTPELECPICQGTEFEAFNGRNNARCTKCRSVERNRLMWMTLDRLGGFQPGKRVLHLAPELGLARKLTELSGEAYQGADLDVERYKSKFIKMRKLDLCTDLGEIPDASYDMILHSHVLEHVPCDVETVLREMDRILAPGGVHFLSVPIRGEKTVEDLSPDLTDAERLARFGQEDHMRIFGSADLQALLTRVWGPGEHLVEPIQLFKRDDLRRAVIPTVAWQGISGHSIFHYKKGARPPAEAFSPPKRKEQPPAPEPAAQSWAAPAANAAPILSMVRAERDAMGTVFPAEDVPPGSDAILGLGALRRDQPWPDFPWDEHAPFLLALDCNGDGGREIIQSLLIEKDIRLMVEIGCFLGGSALHWLNTKPDLELIGVDPWNGNWAEYVESMLTHPTMSRHVEHLSDGEVERIVGLLLEYGNYPVALNNLRAYKDRFYPLRLSSPEALYYLRRRDIIPDLIYIDAFKHQVDLQIAHHLFPDAILCGDDWLWPDETGKFVMQDVVKNFAHDQGFEVEAKRQSWVLHRR